MSKEMSIHQFSAFTSDIKRNPWLLNSLLQEASASINFKGKVTTTEHGPVTTVTAVAA